MSSERNTDFEFGEDFSLDLDLVPKPTNKRTADSPPREPLKRCKVYTTPTTVVKRKFPGPAGILPDLQKLSSCDTSKKKNDIIPCSQRSISVFQSSPWVDLIKDFRPLMEKYDVEWIKTNAALNKLPNRRAPFLGVMIHNIELYPGKNLIVKVILKDMSGEIHGTIIDSLYEEYSDVLVAGSGLVLRQCGVLTTTKDHYLTIMPNNLVTVYEKKQEQLTKIKVQEVSCDDLVKEIENTEVKKSGGEQKVHDVLDGLDIDLFFEDF